MRRSNKYIFSIFILLLFHLLTQTFLQLSEGEDEESTEKYEKTSTYDTSILGSEGIGYVWKYGNEG